MAYLDLPHQALEILQRCLTSNALDKLKERKKELRLVYVCMSFFLFKELMIRGVLSIAIAYVSQLYEEAFEGLRAILLHEPDDSTSWIILHRVIFA